MTQLTSATQCPSCGAGVDALPARCRKCGTVIAAQPPPPTSRGIGISTEIVNDVLGRIRGLVLSDYVNGAAARSLTQAHVSGLPSFAGLSSYYQKEFIRIEDSNGTYKGRWNWAAFFFGPVWALSKGLWVGGIIAAILSLATQGFLILPIAFLYGRRGNYFYYSKFIKE